MEKDIDLTCKALQASFLRRHFASLFLARQVICHTWSHTSGKRPKKRLLQPSPSCGALISAFQPFHFLELCKKRNRKLGNPWFFKVFPPFFPILNPSLLRPINRMPWPRRIAAWSKSCLAKAGELQIADCPTGHRINIDMDIDYHIYIYIQIYRYMYVFIRAENRETSWHQSRLENPFLPSGRELELGQLGVWEVAVNSLGKLGKEVDFRGLPNAIQVTLIDLWWQFFRTSCDNIFKNGIWQKRMIQTTINICHL